ncbi:MAG TPA: helix-turn-helix domain-containing protein [Vicinamibacterales bacterium]|jgi:transcriptional regulator GlxA family with amidase domain|nr:helix-turn-helix domain-containing protein [Vicinamibacterales bacterium]
MPVIHHVPRAEIVARVNEFLRRNLGEPVTVTELSRVAGVSERTLRAAFHDVVGVSPKQHMLRERLRAARAALRAAAPGTTTVTDVAMSYGFFELGRFAGRYRHTFGEAPSRTLRLRHEVDVKIA